MFRTISYIFPVAILAFTNAACPQVAYAADDQAFITEAIKGDNSEITLGRLAAQKGGSNEVREFGRILEKDHGKGKKEAIAAARKLGVASTDEITSQANKEKSKLESRSGAAFDREFAFYMVSDHEEDIAKFEKQADAGKGISANLARQTLPTLRKHLAIAKKLSSSE